MWTWTLEPPTNCRLNHQALSVFNVMLEIVNDMSLWQCWRLRWCLYQSKKHFCQPSVTNDRFFRVKFQRDACADSAGKITHNKVNYWIVFLFDSQQIMSQFWVKTTCFFSGVENSTLRFRNALRSGVCLLKPFVTWQACPNLSHEGFRS